MRGATRLPHTVVAAEVTELWTPQLYTACSRIKEGHIFSRHSTTPTPNYYMEGGGAVIQ